MEANKEEEKLFYYSSGDKAIGPYTWPQLVQLAASGKLKPTDRVWQEGIGKVVAAGSVKGLFTPAVKAGEPTKPQGTDSNHDPRGDRESVRPPNVDFRPLIPRSDEGVYVRSEKLRDTLYQQAVTECQRRGIVGEVLRSPPFAHPCWLKIEFWARLPVSQSATKRAKAVVTISPKPFFKHEFEYWVDMDFCGSVRKVGPLGDFGINDLAKLIDYLSGGDEPSFYRNRLRQFAWEIWLPKNKVDSIKTDWMQALPKPLAVFGLLALPIYGLGILLLIASLVIFVLGRSRDRVTLTSGKPHGEPRNLLLLDSWQTVMFGAGANTDSFKEQLNARLTNSSSASIKASTESIWYWGLDGAIEREQFVLFQNRAIVFVHVHRYDNDLYVSWDGHLNRGQWVEQDLLTGIHTKTQMPTVIKTLVAGTQTLTEYDLNDASMLIEWVHSQVVRAVKLLLEELKIDQEIDFKIVREPRRGFNQSEQPANQGGEKRTFGSMLRRVS